MNTDQFSSTHYTPTGKTRAETRKTVIVAGTYNIECYPFPDVDIEIEYICKMAKVRCFVLFLIGRCIHGIDLYSSGSSRGGTRLRLLAGSTSYSIGAIRLKYVMNLFFFILLA